jgi:methionyl-tRNA formyltransferase
MLEAVDLVRAGKAPKILQDESKKTYESWCKAENAEIAWLKPVAEVHNLIRGTDPSPGAWSRLNGKVVQLFGSSKTGKTGGAPGEVVAVGPDGIVIACAGGQVRISRARAEGGQKLEAGAFAASVGLKPGAKFG